MLDGSHDQSHENSSLETLLGKEPESLTFQVSYNNPAYIPRLFGLEEQHDVTKAGKRFSNGRQPLKRLNILFKCARVLLQVGFATLKNVDIL